MRNPLQTLVTHAEAAFDSFPAALGRALYAVSYAIESAGMTPGKARATFVSTGHAFPLVVVSCMADGPDLPDPPDLEADGYSWGPNARDLLYRGLTPPDTTETPC